MAQLRQLDRQTPGNIQVRVTAYLKFFEIIMKFELRKGSSCLKYVVVIDFVGMLYRKYRAILFDRVREHANKNVDCMIMFQNQQEQLL